MRGSTAHVSAPLAICKLLLSRTAHRAVGAQCCSDPSGIVTPSLPRELAIGWRMLCDVDGKCTPTDACHCLVRHDTIRERT